uniref:AAA+ ATPase domain-containing protein n=1 Tax=Setaria viridis TaxID=4556 RepID=A0A4U6U8V0_SETVI|nr:hypothetical protein SEVIR_6G148100v2 [Setaria viridis]
MIEVTASALMGVIDPLLDKLSAVLQKDHAKLKGVSQNIAFLRDELSSMNTVLAMVSESDEVNPLMKEWMCQLRELAYDIEDCIEIFMHHLNRDGACNSFIHKMISKIITLKACYQIGDQINELKERALEVSDRHKRYELDLSGQCSKSVVIDPRLPALFEEGDTFVGIDSQRDILVKWLTDSSDSHPQRKVVSVVGFGGLGKTTLVNCVFRRIRSQFDCMAFVSVSRCPNVNKILADVLLQVLKRSSSITEDQNKGLYFKGTLGYLELVNMIREHLQNKRYFVIIDDIWSKQAWKDIECAFPHNNSASRIITTTRIQDVAENCSSPHRNYVYLMKPLDNDDSRRLFLKRVFCEGDCPLELKEVVDDILRKCDGLPLAIVNIASLLATIPASKKQWEKVRNSLLSALKQHHELEVVKRILLLSYYDLPHHLKICLLDLSMFPEDHEIDRLRLIRIWMAEGFIVHQRGQYLEDTGENYINELINRNMIQPVDINYSGRPRACRVHDIMHDLIISISLKENFATIVDDHKLSPLAYKIRRLTLVGNCEEQNLWQGSNILSHVRSFSVFGDVKKMPSIMDFQVLRVLDLHDCSNLEDGDIGNVGNLIHLRYLSLSNSNISKVPRQIERLQHLQTLDLRLEELPATVAELRELVRLFLPTGVRLPNGFSNLEALEELSGLDVSRNSPEIMLELGNLTKMKVLGIVWYLDGSVIDKGRFKQSLISSLCRLGERNLQFLSFTSNSGSSVDFLADSWCPPPRHLQTLFMCGLTVPSFFRLPKWISSLVELTCLEIFIEQLRLGDLQVLRDFPSLLCLRIYLKESPQETLRISPVGFQFLKELCFYPLDGNLASLNPRNRKERLSLTFEAGAMPRLELLHFRFAAHGSFDFGISHLISLRHLRVFINCRGVNPREVDAAEAAIRNAAALLPNHPLPGIFRAHEGAMVQEEHIDSTDHLAQQLDGSRCKQKKIRISSFGT